MFRAFRISISQMLSRFRFNTMKYSFFFYFHVNQFANYYNIMFHCIFPLFSFQFQTNDKFEEEKFLKPAQLDNIVLCRSLVNRLSRARHIDARELARILSKPHVKALIETHDEIGSRTLEPKPPIDPRKILSKEFIEATEYGMPGAETIRMVGLRRKQNEPLGLTVQIDEYNQLVVARILAGGMIDRQALLHLGDVILEVNGAPVSTPEGLQDQIMLAKEAITLKIGPSVDEEMKSARLQISSGGQVKINRNLDTGKKLTVSSVLLLLIIFTFI